MQTRIVPVPEAEAVKVVPHADVYPRMNLIAKWNLGAEKTIHFNAHFDVVPGFRGSGLLTHSTLKLREIGFMAVALTT